MAATAIYSVTMVLWKETAFPLCRATEKRWKRNVVSRVSSVIVVIRLPISCVSSMAMYQLSLWQMGSVYWPIWSICLSCSVLSCGLLHLVYLPCCQWDSANVSGTVTFQAFLSPMAGEWSHLGVCFHPASGWLALKRLASELAWLLSTGCHSNIISSISIIIIKNVELNW